MKITRRDFMKESLVMGGSLISLTSLLGCAKIVMAAVEKEKEFEVFPVQYLPNGIYFSDQKPIVSIVKINEKWSNAKGIDYAVSKAIDLIGGIKNVTKGKERILLKPNLVSPAVTDTTKPLVIESLAKLMKKTGKDVYIGEASAASIQNFDISVGGTCRTKNSKTLQALQDDVFNKLGYVELSKKFSVPLVNLHIGKMAKMNIPDNFVFKEIFIHEALYNADLICSVPMMKTHGLANVTLALKNVGIGGFPGLVYGTVRSEVHKKSTDLEPTGTSTAIVDMVKANKIGLNIIDASIAMQGQGPSASGGGELVKMNLIIASTNALAADMVAAKIMGFESEEIDTFKWAWKAGMKPKQISDIEIAGEKIGNVRKQFRKPLLTPYAMMRDWWGTPCKNNI